MRTSILCGILIVCNAHIHKHMNTGSMMHIFLLAYLPIINVLATATHYLYGATELHSHKSHCYSWNQLLNSYIFEAVNLHFQDSARRANSYVHAHTEAAVAGPTWFLAS